MADNLVLGMTEREPAIDGFPRLAGGFDVRQLARIGTMASGEVNIGLASRHTDDHLRPETHKEHLSVRDGFASMAERLRRWRHTTVGRWATIVAMAGPAVGLTIGAAGCGSDGAEARPGATSAVPGGLAGGNGLEQTPGVDRTIIGDAACYEGFGALTAEKQAECIDEFNDLSLEQVKTLSPLDQARWSYGYYNELTGNQPGANADRLTWSGALKKEIPLNAISGLILMNRTMDVARLSWMMQQSDKAPAEDERTWAAMFGLDTKADSQPIKDARALVDELPAGEATVDQYLQRAAIRNQLFTTNPQGVKATEEKDGGFTITFTATHVGDGEDTVFTYRYFKYLYLDSDPNGNPIYKTLTPDEEVKILQGQPLIGVPVAGNA